MLRGVRRPGPGTGGAMNRRDSIRRGAAAFAAGAVIRLPRPARPAAGTRHAEGPGQPGVPRRRRRRLAQRHRHRRANHYVTDLDEEDFAVFEDGVKQNVTFFTRKQQPIALSLLLDSSASMEDKLPTRRKRRPTSSQAAEAERPRPGHRLRQPRRDPAGVHRATRPSWRRRSADLGRRLDVAAQRDLHLAEGAEEDRGA